ncbi:transcriptional regulator [Pseudomonas helleri]|uniref:Transcriptional regulator n=2 Tax=Pseudomonas helleri TaxID=1608996 RepID=A0A7X1WEQ6_9PSED|nr:Rha family transcriptional regulator [Pseudomonas helleri]MQT50231.1 transcriptional regulator [Pseudomonas helleri]
MKAIAPVSSQVLVELVDGHPTTTSLDVAAHFGKRHDTVLRAVRQLECSPEFRLHNFAEASQEVVQPNGGLAKYPVVRMTRDGFTFLCMGFTGKEAAKWKEAYINAFNQMETVLKDGIPTKAKRKPKLLPNGLTGDQQDAIKALVKARVEELPESKRAKAAITCWSSLKSKFGCTYKEISPEQFTDAVSLIARVVLEGELLDPEEPKVVGRLDINYPIEDWQAKNPQQFRRDDPNSPDLLVGYGDLLLSKYSPCLELLDKLHNAGYCIDGAYYEFRSYQNLMAQMDMTVRMMAGSIKNAFENFEHDRRRLQKYPDVKGRKA